MNPMPEDLVELNARRFELSMLRLERGLSEAEEKEIRSIDDKFRQLGLMPIVEDSEIKPILDYVKEYIKNKKG